MDRISHGDVRSLVIDMEAGESLHVTVPANARTVDHTVQVQMLAKSGKRARVRVLAAPGIQVSRHEKEETVAG